jgi:hypothetical protein
MTKPCGTPAQGQTLSASSGSWANAPTSLRYQWQRCTSAAVCTAITGAAAATVTPDDVGSTLRALVTGVNRFGSASPIGAPTAAVT